MKRAGAPGRYLVLDRPAGQLVAEHEVAVIGYQHARSEALVDVVGGRLNEAVEQPRFGSPRHDRDGIEHLSRR